MATGSSTLNENPNFECPSCRFQCVTDDYGDAKAGDVWRCQKCDKACVVALPIVLDENGKVIYLFLCVIEDTQ